MVLSIWILRTSIYLKCFENLICIRNQEVYTCFPFEDTLKQKDVLDTFHDMFAFDFTFFNGDPKVRWQAKERLILVDI